MSPLTLRRYRAERLLREEFEGLRGRVITTVRRRLGASGARLDQSDLEACYAQAWQGLYAAVLDGQEIANPTGWLTLVTFRRAIEELRAHRHIDRRGAQLGPSGSEPGAVWRVAPLDNAPSGVEDWIDASVGRDKDRGAVDRPPTGAHADNSQCSEQAPGRVGL